MANPNYKIENLVGQEVHNLKILSFFKANKSSMLICECFCGRIINVTFSDLTRGHTKSCGCLRQNRLGKLNFKDLSGMVFSRLTVIGRLGSDKRGEARWLCICTCGIKTILTGYLLRSGMTRSCGCLLRETRVSANTTHGLSKTSEYKVWSKMLARCFNENNPAFPGYGGRGITVCKEWLGFENFIKDMGPRPDKTYTIERVNNNGNYEPKNCVWGTRKDQARNRRNSIVLKVGHNEKTLAEISEIHSIKYTTLRFRLKKGWTLDKALFTPVRGSRENKVK